MDGRAAAMDGRAAGRPFADIGTRGLLLFGFWLILTGADPADLVVGVVAAVAATWVSLRLLPPGSWRIRPLALLALLARLALESVRAGVDVSWRALHPQLPLQPGFLAYRLTLPPGLPRDLYGILTSLMPGTVAAGREGSEHLLVHCLDLRLPVAEQLAAEEVRLARALGSTPKDA